MARRTTYTQGVATARNGSWIRGRQETNRNSRANVNRPANQSKSTGAGRGH